MAEEKQNKSNLASNAASAAAGAEADLVTALAEMKDSVLHPDKAGQLAPTLTKDLPFKIGRMA